MNATERFPARARRTVGVLVGLLLAGAVSLAQGPVTPAPAKVLVADVIVQGSKTTPPQRILSFIKTRPGAEFNQETLNEDVRQIYAKGFFANVCAEKKYNPDGNVIIYFNVADTPSII